MNIEQQFKITNYYEHPGNASYLVFHYFEPAQAETFENYLKEAKITFEKHIDTDTPGKRIYLFAIHRTHRKKAEQYNFLTIGKHRDPFIPYAWMRWLLFAAVAGIILLAIIGYMKSK